MTVTERTVRANGVQSFVREAGRDGASEAVVFLHGNPGSSSDFADLLPRASEFARAIAVDMPGYGQAERPRDFDYTVEGYARHFGALLDELGVRRVHLVLHDFGGPWGLAWAADHGDRVASITLFNVGVVPGYTWHKFARIWRLPVIGELFQLTTTKTSFKVLAGRDNPKPFPDAFIDETFSHIDWPMKRAVLRLYRATNDLGALTTRYGEALAPRKIPALVVWGAGDRYLSVRYAEVQKKYFDADVHVIDGAGHWPMIDEPERVRELVIPFLRKHACRA
jgi:pimeloyl-ACP methyl ester carboxylesterase